MKKALITIASASTYLLSATQAFATAPQNLNPCPQAGPFTTLCTISGDMGRVLGFVVTIAFIIAVLVALFFLIWGGIKWITSGGDKGGVEAARNQIIAAIVGLIIVFLSFFILNLVLGLFGLNLFQLTLPNITQF